MIEDKYSRIDNYIRRSQNLNKEIDFLYLLISYNYHNN